MKPDTLAAELKQAADWLFQDLDLVNRRGLLVKFSEQDYRNASFLDQRALRPGTQGAWLPLPRLLEMARDIRPPLPPHAIFHVSHCGSTLVSRLLAELPGCLPLREPLPLLTLAQARRDLALPTSRLDTAGWDTLFALFLRLGSRNYRAGERVVIKATSACANLLPHFLEQAPASRALLLYTDLETWLATMLRDETVRENGRFYAPAWLTDFMSLTGREDLKLAVLSDAEQFALNWLAGMLHFQRAQETQPGRVQSCDFEGLLAATAEGLRRTGGFFGLDTGRANELAASTLMRSYAKNPGRRYDPDHRRQELKAARSQVGGEIAAGLAYAEKLVKETPKLAPLAQHFSRGT